MEQEEIYLVKPNLYKMFNDESAKHIIFNNKKVGISVGANVNFKKEFKCTLLIDIHYDSDNQETLTYPLEELESHRNIIAINPKFKNKELINQMKELNIISDTIKTIKKGKYNYELVSVNLEELKLYKPFGSTILKDFREIDYSQERNNEYDY